VDFGFSDFYRSLEQQLDEFYRAMQGQGLRSDTDGAASLSTLLDPVDPFNRNPWLVPFVRVAGVTALVCLSGVAVGAFVISITALLAIYYLLSQVFGFEIELNQ
jgi:hypothetical protein